MSSPHLTQELPITGLCIVEDLCPTGYVKIDRCWDNNRTEADMWKDGIFAKKVKRFLCITRVFPLDGGKLNNALVDISMVEDTETLSAGWSKIASTLDTSEPALKKKQLCVKMVPRSSVTEAITDIIFLCKATRPPNDYTLLGDVGNLRMCYKIGPVLGSDQQSMTRSHGSQSSGLSTGQGTAYSLPYPLPNHGTSISVQGADNSNYSASNLSNMSLNRQVSHVHALSGVPFEINARFQSSEMNTLFGLESFEPKSRESIFAKYNYSFTSEENALSTFQNFNFAVNGM